MVDHLEDASVTQVSGPASPRYPGHVGKVAGAGARVSTMNRVRTHSARQKTLEEALEVGPGAHRAGALAPALTCGFVGGGGGI